MSVDDSHLAGYALGWTSLMNPIVSMSLAAWSHTLPTSLVLSFGV
jgi:hypothetical protein